MSEPADNLAASSSGAPDADSQLAEGFAANKSPTPASGPLVLERLREIRVLLGDVKEDTMELRLRVGMIETGYAVMSLRLDRLDTRMDRIERRLGLLDPAVS
jgi:hypothetical protein